MEPSSLLRARTTRREENVIVYQAKYNNPRKNHNRHPKIEAVAVLDVDRQNMYVMPPPNRHRHVIQAMSENGIVSGKEGFITDELKFVDREVALIYAMSNKQLRIRPAASPTDYAGSELFSEDLW